ncbi:MAG TPA: hypothetical protein VGN21_15075 [Stellaceae bacterium]
MLENLTKSDVLTAAGLGLAAAMLSELLPNAKPLVRSAIQFGVDLLTESEAEAEAELVQSLIEATLHCIRQDLSEAGSEPERRQAVLARVEHFKKQARVRAHRWGSDPQDRHRRYRHHVARPEASLARHKHDPMPERDRRVLDYASKALAAEA